MATLYVTEPGARIEKEYQRILVSKEDNVLIAVPLRQISEVVLMGWVGATIPAMLSLLDNGVGLSLINQNGKLRGRLRPVEVRNIALRKLQYTRQDDPAFITMMTQALVWGKLKNCRTLARRILRKLNARQDENLEKLSLQFNRLVSSLKKVPLTEQVDALRGLEGSGTKAYFSILRAGLQCKDFSKRTRRPPTDPVNALLSLGYTLLGDSLFTACEIVGLDPYAGYFHTQKYGRPALALDLMEEFRPIIVDSIVLRIINNRMLKPSDFYTTDEGGVFLKRRGLAVFFREYARRMATKVYHPQAERALSYQKCFEVQARQLRKAIEGETQYHPMQVK